MKNNKLLREIDCEDLLGIAMTVVGIIFSSLEKQPLVGLVMFVLLLVLYKNSWTFITRKLFGWSTASVATYGVLLIFLAGAGIYMKLVTWKDFYGYSVAAFIALYIEKIIENAVREKRNK